jgi:hypothetical protein
MMTVVPGLGLNGWEGLVARRRAGAGLFGNYKFGTQDFGGRCKSSRLRGLVSIHFLRLCRLSGPTLLRCRPYGRPVGVDMYILERISVLAPSSLEWQFFRTRTTRHSLLPLPPDNTPLRN